MKQSIFIIIFCLLYTCFNTSCNFDKALATSNSQKIVSNFSKITLQHLVPSYEFSKYSFEDIAVIGNEKIWSVGYDGEDPSRVRFSDDGGKTWRSINISSNFTMPDSIFFSDDLHGWVAGNGDILRTSDGGKNWEMTDLKENIAFSQLSFYNQQIGYVAGKLNVKENESSKIWFTNDGGITWVKSYENKEWQNVFSILAVSEYTSIAILDERHLIKTDNSGKNWQIVNTFNYSTNKLYKDKAGQVWAVGRDGNFFYSTDNAQTWNRPLNFPEPLLKVSWNSVSFIDQQRGFAVGDKGAFALTLDGGITWEFIESSTKDNLSKIYLSQSVGFIIGSDKIYKFEF